MLGRKIKFGQQEHLHPFSLWLLINRDRNTALHVDFNKFFLFIIRGLVQLTGGGTNLLFVFIFTGHSDFTNYEEVVISKPNLIVQSLL